MSLRLSVHRLFAGFLAMVLACSLGGVGTGVALAAPQDDGSAAVTSAQQTLDEATARMDEINAEYEALSVRIAELQKQIDANTAAALAAQEAMLEGRESLARVVVGEYRDGGTTNLLMMVLDSKTFIDLLRNMDYADQIMSHQAEEVQQQRERKAAFDEVSETLNRQKNEQEAALAAQAEKRAEAQAVVADAESKLADAKSEHSARLEALAAQALALEEDEPADGPAVVQGADTIDRQEVVPDSTPVKPNPKPVEEEKPTSQPETNNSSVSDKPAASDGDSSKDGSSSNSSSGDSSQSNGSSTSGDSSTNSSAGSSDSSASNGGWMTGIASAYGGSTDPYTPNPGTTATGALCDDYSMGVAVPMSTPGYSKLFNRGVEISWNGKTVYAVVNDCGSMGGGSRVLDLQPGVWKAFGFNSCLDWGLRTVNYRFL